MDTDIIVALIVLAQAVGVAVINNRMKRRDESNAEYRKAREEKEKERDEADRERYRARKELDVAILGLTFANAEANEVLLHRAHGDQVNGNVDEALSRIGQAKAHCNDLVNQAAMN